MSTGSWPLAAGSWKILFLFAALAQAQISPPFLGMTPDGARVRAIYGLPAAAATGEIGPDRDLANIAISPRQNFAIASAMDNGDVGLVIPGRDAVRLENVPPNPGGIVVSPTGSAAALWYPASSHFEIVTGVPDAPMVRDVDATYPGAPHTYAVSDDGWLAGVFDTGVYAFAPDGAVLPLTVDDGVQALAFFAGRSDLVMATSTRVFAAYNVAGNLTTATLYDSPNQPLAPAGIAVSPDNRNVVLADLAGTVYAIDLEAQALAIVDCGCSPSGVFALSNSVFRLTETSAGSLVLFDAKTSSTPIVPVRAVPGAQPGSPSPAAEPIPSLTIGGLPQNAGLAGQLSMTISIGSPFQSDIAGTAVLRFTPASGGDDQTIQFGSGGRSVNFTIPAGSTQAQFSGKTSIAILTGTVAGRIDVSVNETAPDSVSSVALQTVVTAPTAPVIASVALQHSSGGLTVVVTGYSPTRDVSSGVFSFTAGANSSIAQSSLTVQLAAAFNTWFQNSASNAFGSQFTLTVPFNVQGDSGNVVRVAVVLTNGAGVSGPASSQ